MSDNNGPRKPVKATYAHKKSRSTKAQLDPVALSSPFQSLDSVAQGSDTVYASNAEMTRRMLKRSHHATKNDKVPQPTEVDRKAKRTKHSIAPIALNSIINEEYSMSLNDLRPIDHSDATQFQTPFGEAYVHPSAISKPLVQEQMSPIPIANRILSRTSSRNLKENSASKSASSKGLASPFASRHSSANSSPRSKNRSKSRPKQNSRISRPALTTKSHSTTSSHNQNNSHSQSQFHTYLQEPYLSTNQSARASPDRLPDSKSITRNRYPSSHTLTQIPPQDWLVPPKALSKQSREDNDDVDMHTPPDFGVAVGSSSFLANSPMAFSTPLPPRERHRQAVTRAENVPGSGISTRGSLEFSPHALIINPNFDDNNGDDVMITNSSRKIPRAPSQKILHISGNSIFSSSGDFTLAQTQNSAVPSPFSSKHARISKSSKTLNDSIFQSNNDISQNESLEVTSSQSHSKPKESIPEHDIALYQLTSPAPLRLSSPAPQDRSSSFLDELMAAPIPMPTPMSSPKGVPVGTDAINIYPENPEGLLNDLFDDMVFDDGEKSSISTQARLTFRTRSLDDSASVLVESSELEGGKQKTGRNRAGTIRASEYQQQRTSVVANTNSRALPTELSLSRRTRSGTITGPRASVLPTTTSQKYNIAPAFRKHISSSSKSPESDDELLLKAPGWVDEDLEYLGLPNHARTLTAQTDEEPDELMLTGQWRDVHEGWPAQT